jgi:hypothetical protein
MWLCVQLSGRKLSTPFIFFFFVVGLGFELRPLHLQSRHSTSWNTPPDYFAVVIWRMGSCKLLAYAGLEPPSCQSQPPKQLRLQACAIAPSHYYS